MTVRRTRIACCVTKATETHSEYVISYLLLFHGNSGYANARHCYILRTLPVLFVKAMLGCKGAVKLHHVVDIDIISRSRKSLQEVTVALDRAARMMGLEINQAKTKYMICGNKKRNVKNVSNVKHVTFERVNSFEYPRTLITNRNDNSAEINNWITLANRSYFGKMNMLKAKNINRKHKVTMHKTLIKPVLVYGAETWVLSKVDVLGLGDLRGKY